MIFNILINQITTLFLGMNIITTLSFDDEVQSYLYGGSKEEVFFQVTNKQKTLVLKPLVNTNLSNLLVLTKNGKYYFELRVSDKNSHQFIEIRPGKINSSFSKKLEDERFELMEGSSSVLFINKLTHPINVNGVEVKDRGHFSKGVPIIYEGVRILN